MHRFTGEQADFIKKNVIGKSRKELTQIVNNCFSLDLKVNQITAYIKNYGLNNGLDGRFEPGHVPANKGTHNGGWEPTQFKKGNRPHNYLPVGTERVNGDDYVDIKVADPNKWRTKHSLIWQEHNGSIPKGHVIIFGDGNRRNFNLDNLILVSRQQLRVLNQKSLIQNDAELTKTAVAIADVYLSIYKRT